MTIRRVSLALACTLLAWGDPRALAADAAPAPAGSSAASAAPAATRPARLPVFVPPNRGAPKTRVGGATRGARPPGLASLDALVPEDGGLTLEAQPVLYWYLSEATNGRIDLTIVDEASVAPLLETTIEGPLTSGVHPIRLADHGVSLAPGVDYQWFVALVPDAAKRSSDVIAGGGIARMETPEALREKLARATGSARVNALAEAGIWYDALAATSREIEKSPGDAQARDARAALLEQVGLAEIARHERAAPAESPSAQGRR